MRAIVTGGRNYGNIHNDKKSATKCKFEITAINLALTYLKHTLGITSMAFGDAGGVDSQALAWAKFNNIPYQRLEAEWKKFGKAAGPIRNEQMRVKFNPHCIIAFPGDVGTADMSKRGKKAQVPVLALSEPKNMEPLSISRSVWSKRAYWYYNTTVLKPGHAEVGNKKCYELSLHEADYWRAQAQREFTNKVQRIVSDHKW